MSLDWNSFSAFNSTLDRSFLDKKGSGLQEQINECYEWLRSLRNNPMRHGIPVNRAEDVRKIFQAMSGVSRVPLVDCPPIIRPIFDHFDGMGNIHLDPIWVRFGPSDTLLPIIDSASALGYIFSIAQPPKSTEITWSSYFLPLLVLYSQCLYLVFAKDETGSSNLCGVPIMASVMYLSDSEGDKSMFEQPFLFGSTLAAGLKDPYFKNRRGIASTWRRESLLEQALHASGQTIPAWLTLDSTQNVLDALTERLHRLLKGVPQVTDVASIEYTLVENMAHLAKDIKVAVLTKKHLRGDTAVLFNQLLRDVRTKAEIEQLLHDVIRRRYAPNYSRQDQAYLISCRTLLHYYIKPHIFAMAPVQLQAQGQIFQEVNWPTEELDALRCIFDPLWEACKEALLDKVDYLKYAQEMYEDPPAVKVYGRCAETYPLVDVQPCYFPAAKDRLKHVRGLAMEPRAIGTTDLFETHGFTNSTLKMIPKHVVPSKHKLTKNGTTELVQMARACRYPCSNCRRLLPLLGVHAQLPPPVEYDKDLAAADVDPT